MASFTYRTHKSRIPCHDTYIQYKALAPYVALTSKTKKRRLSADNHQPPPLLLDNLSSLLTTRPPGLGILTLEGILMSASPPYGSCVCVSYARPTWEQRRSGICLVHAHGALSYASALRDKVCMYQSGSRRGARITIIDGSAESARLGCDCRRVVPGL